jgi:hypothetical protein
MSLARDAIRKKDKFSNKTGKIKIFFEILHFPVKVWLQNDSI